MKNKAIVLICIVVTLFILTNIAHTQYTPKWWNVSWRHRVMLEINSTAYDRTDWPVEWDVNFTQLLNQLSDYGTFDNNSLRVIEHNSTGYILHEIPSQFDKADNYNASTNAVGTVVFLMNGTTGADTKRYFYLYFDTVENGAKQSPNYPININYTESGDEINVNVTKLRFFLDTNRSENTSGLYRVSKNVSGADQPIIEVPENNKTVEYIQYSNSTTNLTFDLTGEYNITIGPVRMTVTQKGDEIEFGNLTAKTNKSTIIKKTYFYYKAGPQSYGSWLKIEQNLTNAYNGSILRNSTSAGALPLDLGRGLYNLPIATMDSNTTETSWAYARDSGGDVVGIININETGTTNYFALNESGLGRIGIQLNTTNIPENGSITETAIIYFATGGGSAVTEFNDIRDRFSDPVNITQLNPESWSVMVQPQTDYTIYNRNETAVITANITYDPDGLVYTVNATLDMGTAGSGDDETIILYDDGTHGDETADDRVFTSSFNFTDNHTTGEWNITIKAYTDAGFLLNQSWVAFNLTRIYNVNVTVITKTLMTNEIANVTITVKNYRNDTYIPNATINCTYNTTDIDMENLTYDGNIYYLNFTAPTEPGEYILNCTTTRNNNTGYDRDNFTAETAATDVEINTTTKTYTSSNITLAVNESFNITAKASNTGNATARYANLSLELPSGWNSAPPIHECGNITPNNNCTTTFNVTIPNATSPGNYTINVTVQWENPNTSVYTNRTEFNVTVESNPVINSTPDNISGNVSDGMEQFLGNFTVYSIGNDELLNVTFNVSGLDAFTINFTPVNISNLTQSLNQSVQINATVPAGYSPGIYNGTVNISSANNGFHVLNLSITVPEITPVGINTTTKTYTSSNITLAVNESFNITAKASNTGNATARYANLSLELPSGWNSAPPIHECGNITPNNNCTTTFNVTIPNATSPGNYTINVTVQWENPNTSVYTNRTEFNVTVESNPVINSTPDNISGNVSDGMEQFLGNFTVYSIGNDELLNVTFNVSGLDAFTINFTPVNISNLTQSLNQSVQINATVPAGYSPGIYNGTVNINSANNGFTLLNLSLNVTDNRSWYMTPTSCQRSESPEEGTACEVLVNNTGNTWINFSITPITSNDSMVNYTWTNITNFTLQKGEYEIFYVLYNVTGVTKTFYNTTYTVTANESDAKPQNITILIELIPYVEPLISINITPQYIPQRNRTEIFVNVTDRSTTGINKTLINITRPNGTVDSFAMNNTYTSGNLSTWYLTYPNSTTITSDSGNTSRRGKYSVVVFTQDNTGVNSTDTSEFYVHAKMETDLSTGASTYYQGREGFVNFVARDNNSIPLQNANVTFTIWNPNALVIYNSTFQTDQSGSIFPLPIFTITSDATLGVYNLSAFCSYNDTTVNHVINETKNTSFEVLYSSGFEGLFADLETDVVWYPNSIMNFSVMVYDASGMPVDPDSINLTVYDPANNIYLTVRFNATNTSQRRTTGWYTYSHAMGVGTATGVYFGVVNVSKGSMKTMRVKAFKVSAGGPYDVEVTPLEDEVYLQDFFDFEILIKNMGEVGQDVDVEYWVASADNRTWYYKNFTVYVDSFENKTLIKSAYIYASQSLGTHVINVKVTYDLIQSPITSSATFEVVQRPPVTPPAPGPPPAPPTEIPPAYSLLISEYPHDVNIVRGWELFYTVKVNNTGEGALTNVSLILIGIPSPWFEIEPNIIENLSVGNTTIFKLTFKIPLNAPTIGYTPELIVSSAEDAGDTKKINLTIFKSQYELIKNEIKKLEDEYDALEKETALAERYGKNVTRVLSILESIRTHIEQAEANLKNESYTLALENTEAAWDLIERAKNELAAIEPYIVVIREEGLPLWQIIIMVAVLIVSAFTLFFFWKRKIYTRLELKEHLMRMRDIAKLIRREHVMRKPELQAERDKILKVIELLNRERKEGVITEKTYKELIKRNKEKLRDIEKKK